MDLDQIPKIVMILGMSGVMIGSVLLMLTTFSTSLTTTNTTASLGAAAGVGNVTAGITNLSSQFGTIGTFAGIVVLIVFLIGGIYYAFGGRGSPVKENSM